MADNKLSGFVRIREAKKMDPEKIHQALQKGYRVEHPEKIAGYRGFFFDLGNVYLSNELAGWAEENEKLREFIFDSVARFDKADFGEISELAYDTNIENRYLFGGTLFGRYGFGRSSYQNVQYEIVIRIRYWEGNTYITDEFELENYQGLSSGDLACRDIDDR